MKIFELDVTQCALPPYWGSLPKVIRLVEGRYELDFDVADTEVNAEANKIPEVVGNPNKPIGFNANTMPVWAVLRRLPDQEEE